MTDETKKILVATDFSAYANRTQHAAGALYAQKSSRMTLLHVLDTSQFLFPENRLTPNLLPELVKVASINLRRQASLLSKLYGMSVDSHVVCGNPTQEILKVMEADHTNVVIAALEEKNNENSPGIIAHRLAAKSSCPVLTLGYKEHTMPFGIASLIKAKIRLFEFCR